MSDIVFYLARPRVPRFEVWAIRRLGSLHNFVSFAAGMCMVLSPVLLIVGTKDIAQNGIASIFGGPLFYNMGGGQ